MLLGAIADDFTGATDLCNTLVRQGMRTIQVLGVPAVGIPAPDADAIVVALKSRNIEPKKAVRESRAALRWLQAQGAKQIFFKYCSTFDSTPRGNIGPVADALLDSLKGDLTIACPAFPTNGRTVYFGNLFVGGVPLAESGMRNHPLTPMRDSSLVRVLAAQSKYPVGLVPHATVAKGAPAIQKAFEDLRADGVRHAIVDAINDRDLMKIGAACADLALVTGGSGVALGLPENFRKSGRLRVNKKAAALPKAKGSAAVLAGSCSEATLGQIAAMKADHPWFYLDALKLAKGKAHTAEALAWAVPKLKGGPVLIYASASPSAVKRIQRALGAEKAGALVEKAMARIAKGLVAAGVGRLVVAGGETSGAVVGGLGIRALRIGAEIDPGVPWTMSMGTPAIHLALKSGNFGGPDFFTRSFDLLP